MIRNFSFSPVKITLKTVKCCLKCHIFKKTSFFTASCKEIQ
jgi:hypothetical protein